MELFEKLEKEVVDEKYKEFRLLKYPKELAIFYLFKGFGDFEIDLSNSEYDYFDTSRRLYQVLLGLEKCIKWIINNKENPTENSHPTFEEISDMLGEFIHWGFQYNILCEWHIAKWKKYSEAIIDEKNKVVTFSPLKKDVLHFAFQQAVESDEITIALTNKIPDKLLFKEFEKENKNNSKVIVSTEIFNQYLQFYNSIIFPELARDTNLSGYTIEDFILFFTTINLFSKYEIYSDLKKGFSSGIMEDRNAIIVSISKLSSLYPSKVEEIINDLTFQNDNRSRLSNTPFISIGNLLIFSPLIISFLIPNRMLIGAMNKSSKKKIYDRLINDIENYWTDRIYKLLKKQKQFQVLYKNNYSSSNKKITPDFLIFDPRNSELLIIDYKHFMIPITISETINKQSEIRKGEDQIFGYEEFIKDNPEIFQAKIPNFKADKIYKLMLFRFPMPIAKIRKEMTYGSIHELENNTKPNNSLTELIYLLNNKYQGSQFDKNEFTFIEEEIKVNEWKYKYSLLAIKDPTANN